MHSKQQGKGRYWVSRVPRNAWLKDSAAEGRCCGALTRARAQFNMEYEAYVVSDKEDQDDVFYGRVGYGRVLTRARAQSILDYEAYVAGDKEN